MFIILFLSVWMILVLYNIARSAKLQMIFFFFQISTFPEEEFRAAAGPVPQVRKEQDAKDVRNHEDRLPDNAKIRLLCNGVTGLLVPPEFAGKSLPANSR